MPDLGISASIAEAWEELGDEGRAFLAWTALLANLALAALVAVYGLGPHGVL